MEAGQREEEALVKARDDDLTRQQRRIEEAVRAKRQVAQAKRRRSAGDEIEGMMGEQAQQHTPKGSHELKEAAAPTVDPTHAKAGTMAGMLDMVEPLDAIREKRAQQQAIEQARLVPKDALLNMMGLGELVMLGMKCNIPGHCLGNEASAREALRIHKRGGACF